MDHLTVTYVMVRSVRAQCLLDIITIKCVHNVFIVQLDKFLKNPGAYAMPRPHGEQQRLVRSTLLAICDA